MRIVDALTDCKRHTHTLHNPRIFLSIIDFLMYCSEISTVFGITNINKNAFSDSTKSHPP